MKNSFGAQQKITVGKNPKKEYQIFRLDALGPKAEKLPYTLKILLENLLRHEDGEDITVDDIQALYEWEPQAISNQEIAFTPARVILQDFTGVHSS